MLSERQSWRCDTHCVGHEGTIVAARYAPRVFGRPPSGRGTRNGEAPEESETGAGSDPGDDKKEGDDVAMVCFALLQWTDCNPSSAMFGDSVGSLMSAESHVPVVESVGSGWLYVKRHHVLVHW